MLLHILFAVSSLVFLCNAILIPLSYVLPISVLWLPAFLLISIVELLIINRFRIKERLEISPFPYGAPKVIRIVGIVSVAYTILNCALCLYILRDGGPQIYNGVYCLWNHGFVREISQKEYTRLILVESRFFTGQSIAFAVTPMASLSEWYSRRKSLSKN